MTINEFTFPIANKKQLAWRDFKGSLNYWFIWMMLAYNDIKLRYRRSFLGPFWITISMAITVYSMGYLYSFLFRQPMNVYFPFLATGMLAWSLISSNVTDMVDAFNLNQNLLKQIKLPYSLYIHRVAARNLMIFFHNIIILVPLMIIFRNEIPITFNLLLLLLFPGLLVIYVNSIFYGIVLAMIGARYHDISQLIKSLTQIMLFITPVMWQPDNLPLDKKFLVDFNPFYSFIELIRAPLLGYSLTITNIVMVTLVSLIGVLLCYFIFIFGRSHIVYWL